MMTLQDLSILTPKDRKLEKILCNPKALKVNPRDDLVFVDPFEVGEFAGEDRLIAMPDIIRDDLTFAGRVFATGPGKLVYHKPSKDWVRVPNVVDVGDYVIFPRFGVLHYQLEVKGTVYEFVIMKDSLILGTLEIPS